MQIKHVSVVCVLVDEYKALREDVCICMGRGTHGTSFETPPALGCNSSGLAYRFVLLFVFLPNPIFTSSFLVRRSDSGQFSQFIYLRFRIVTVLTTFPIDI